MNERLLDELSRQKIINKLNRNYFVEAGAGSGKTYCLVERMVNLIKKGKAKIENISSVTFTRKAAAELRERFQIRLEQSLSQDLDEAEKENVGEALSNIEQIFIGTIHSFCSRILRERPVEAGVDPGFTEIQEEEDNIFADSVWSEYIEYCHLDQTEHSLDFFEEHSILPQDLKDSYKRVIQFPDVEIITREVLKPDFTDTKKQVSHFISSLRNVIPKEAHENGWDDLQKLIRKALYYIENEYLTDDVRFVKMLKELGKSVKVTQNRWPQGDGKLYEEQMEKFRDNTVRPAINKWQEYLHKPCADFIKRGAEFYAEWRKEHSILNFTDLLTITSGLLKTNCEVRSYFKNKFTHILVDEFQDTDPIQAELFLFLTGIDVNQTDWLKIIPKPGSLFLVGDPKQSIYRFRRADISIYNAVKKIFADGNKESKSNDDVSNEGKIENFSSDKNKSDHSDINEDIANCIDNDENNSSEVLALFSNFRSLPFMKDLVKAVFGTPVSSEDGQSVFPEEESRYQAKYFPLNTVRASSPGHDFGVFENNIKKVSKNNASDVAAVDAKRIADWIDFAVNQGGIRLERTLDEENSGLSEKALYADFLILSRKREHLGHYVRALESRGIPYDISGGKIFNKSVELKEILKLFKAIEDDKDPVALVTALRGLFFGISDSMLYEFSVAGGKFTFYSNVPEGFEEFKKAYKRLTDYKKIVKDKEPITAAEIILEDTGIIPFAVSLEEGLTRAGNIYKALELLRHYKQGEICLFSDLVRNLEELLKVREVESLSLLASRKDVVRIMNLHKAKGLEAPVVILADPLGEVGEFAPELHISRAGSDDASKDNAISKGYFCLLKSSNNYSRDIIGTPPDWEDKSAEETKYDRAERKRLDYVAATRAKNILVVSTYREGSKAKAWEIVYKYLKEINAPELIIRQIKSVKETEVANEVSPAQWEIEKEKISGIIRRLTAPGYKISSVTTEAKEGYLFSHSETDYSDYSSGVNSVQSHKAVNGRGNKEGNDSIRQVETKRRQESSEFDDSESRHGSSKQKYSGQSNSQEINSEKAATLKSGGAGLKYGILAHKVVEIISRGNLQKVKALLGRWAADAGLEEKAARDLTALAEKFSSSDLLKRINNADKKYFEVPFALTQNGSIIHGVIDLVFKEGSKWVIVDYKTGDFKTDNERKSTYLNQLELYKKYWQIISGQEVAETILYNI